MNPVVLETPLSCPTCGRKAREIMPTDACQYFYEYRGCSELLRPKTGDCCVYCSYGTAPYSFQQDGPVRVEADLS